MKINIYKNVSETDAGVAIIIASQILQKPNSVIGMSTGRTTKGIHGAFVELYKKSPFSINDITFLNCDELTNVPRDYAGTCYTLIMNEIIKPLSIDESKFLIPPTYSDDFINECKIFEKAIEEKGGIDLQILGIGLNGHVGFNQPGTAFGSCAHVSVMDEDLDKRVHKETGIGNDVKLGGTTLGIKNIMNAKKLVLAAKGKNKAEIITKALKGPVTEEVPASILQLHPDLTVCIDIEAASLL